VPSKFLEQITLDFDQLYDEAGRRRMIVGEGARPHQRYAADGTGLGRVPALRHEPTGRGVPAQGRDHPLALQSPLTLRETETI
jgi:hypothetical protein